MPIWIHIKFVEFVDIFIVCLYIDDLIFIGNKLSMVTEFTKAIVNHSEITYLGLMSYFLAIEVVHKK